MPFKNIPISKLRAKLIRKGMFTQLPYINTIIEHENRMFRTILDYALYDLLAPDENTRKDVVEWLHPNNNDFKEVCLYACLEPLKVYNMFLFFIQYFTPHYLKEIYCHQKQNGDIIKFSSDYLYPSALSYVK